MKTKIILPIIALIGLGSLVVLGSSPDLVGNFLESIKSSSIAKVFLSEDKNESEKTNPINNGKLPGANVSPKGTLIKADETVANKIPMYILYDKLFRMVLSFKNKSESQETSGERIIGLVNYFKDRANLTDSENQILLNISFEFAQEVFPIDTQAKTIIEDARQKYANGIVSREQTPPDELVNLQEQRNQLALRYRDRLKESLGEDGFAKLDKFVNNDFAAHFQAVPLSSVDFSQEQ